MKRHLVIAPHPDDETLGCGGTLLRAKAAGEEVGWLIVTGISEASGCTAERVAQRNHEIAAAATAYGIDEVVRLDLPTATLDAIPKSDIVVAISSHVAQIKPTDIYLPFRRDAHSDHAVVFDAASAATKWFRYPSIMRIFAYETQSETDFDIAPDSPGFRPNVFVDISDVLEEKLRIAQIFASEFAKHPFPRSVEGIRALATLRGAASGFVAAEAFMLLRARVEQGRPL